MTNEELEKKIISLEQELKRKCREVEELKSSFLGNISHEVRTPMNAIMGFSCLLQDEDVTEEDRLVFIDGIMNSSKNLLRIIDNIIEASKFETDDVKLTIRKFEVADLLLELYHNYKGQISDQIELRVNYPRENLEISSDPVHLKLLLSNLIENAIKFTEKGFIEIGCHKYSEKQLEFYIQDTGIGIAAEDKEEIFQKFSQLDKSRSKKYNGIGIGLTLVKQQAELLDGKLKLSSEPGLGTTFTITIPVRNDQYEQLKKNKLIEKDILIEEKYKRNKSALSKKIEREFSVRSNYTNYRA